MKIWGEIPKILGVYNKQKNVNKVDKASPVSSKKDIVSISNNAKDSQNIMKALKDVPDIRMEKVREISERYETGKYNINGKDVADNILKSVLDKRV